MKWSVLFLCFLFSVCQAQELYSQMFIIPKYTLPQRSGYSILNYDASHQAGAFIKTTLFCTEDRRNANGGRCDYFQNKLDDTLEEESLRDATVSVVRTRGNSVIGSGAGTVIKLKKGADFCNKPLLLTSAHCVNLSGITGGELTNYNHIGGAFISPDEIRELQNVCLDSANKNCLVTPQSMIDASDLGYTGVDQALIPLTNFNPKYATGTIPAYEVDIDKVSTENDLEGCFNGTKATMTTSLREDHLQSDGGPIKGQVTNNIRDLIRKDTCKNLSWMGEKNPKTIRHYITHNCPTLKGLSGSLLTLNCNNKKGFFIHGGSSFGGISDETEKRAKDGESMTFDPNNRSFVNTAFHITPDLLQLFSDNYCGFSN